MNTSDTTQAEQAAQAPQLQVTERTICYNAIANIRDLVISLAPGNPEILQAFENNASQVIAVVRDIANERDNILNIVAATRNNVELDAGK